MEGFAYPPSAALVHTACFIGRKPLALLVDAFHMLLDQGGRRYARAGANTRHFVFSNQGCERRAFAPL